MTRDDVFLGYCILVSTIDTFHRSTVRFSIKKLSEIRKKTLVAKHQKKQMTRKLRKVETLIEKQHICAFLFLWQPGPPQARTHQI